VEVSRTSPERFGEKVPPAFRHYFVCRASSAVAYRVFPPLNFSPPGSTLFPANLYLYRVRPLTLECDQYALYAFAGEAVRTLAPHTGASPRLFSCCGSLPFLPRGNLVRIVRTFEPFPEPTFLPPDTGLRADAAMGGIQKVSWGSRCAFVSSRLDKKTHFTYTQWQPNPRLSSYHARARLSKT